MWLLAWLVLNRSPPAMLYWVEQAGRAVLPTALMPFRFKKHLVFKEVLLDRKELQIHNRTDLDIKDL